MAERYAGQIQEGFKSVIMKHCREFGIFLNQLSSLLIIWVGVYQVVNGELSLGQLIAFRIIAGYVTGPILRLSGLWQGFNNLESQWSDFQILWMIPEAGTSDPAQILTPKGKISLKI